MFHVNKFSKTHCKDRTYTMFLSFSPLLYCKQYPFITESVSHCPQLCEVGIQREFLLNTEEKL